MTAEVQSPVIQVRDLVKTFRAGAGRTLTAADRVSLDVRAGQTLGLVGESGSGKSTVGHCILGLTKATSGSVLYRGEALSAMGRAGRKAARGRLQVVFQDPQSSLDPRMTVRRIVGYPLTLQKGIRGRALTERVLAVLRDVGLGAEHLNRYPHEFSGGQRQRIGIARALITRPDFIVFDEPTSALDVSVQAQILNLVAGLQGKYGYAYLFISHDLAVVRYISHAIAVMYLGRIVETAPKDSFFTAARHPYSKALIASVPRPDPFERQELSVLSSDVPSPSDLPQGCRFAPRCPEALDLCRESPPPRVSVDPDHWVECHLYRERPSSTR